MKKINIFLGTIALVAAMPMVALAQLDQTEGYMDTILGLLDLLVLIILALALVFFLWGVAKFILNAGDPAEQSKGKSIMFWGLIALFVMTAVWGLVAFIQDELGIGDADVERPDIWTN